MNALFDANRQVINLPNYNPRVIEMFVKDISARQNGKEGIEASYDFRERVVGKAISLIYSESAAIPRSMIRALRSYESEKEKYIFKSVKLRKEVGKERLYQLIDQYDRRFCEKYDSFFKDHFENILYEMERYPEYMLYEDMAGFVKAAPIILFEGICSDAQFVLQIYVSCLMRNRGWLNMEELDEGFGPVWQRWKMILMNL